VDDIVEYLQSGRSAKSHAGELMSEVVLNSTSKMSDADVRAIAVYLKALPAGPPEPEVTPPPQEQMDRGQKIYRSACIACHEVDGSGAPRIYPPLPGNANLQSADPSGTLRIILDGAQTLTTPRAPNKGSMPAYPKLSDQERRRRDLHPQCLGQCSAGGDAGAGCESAAAITVHRCSPSKTNFGMSHLKRIASRRSVRPSTKVRMVRTSPFSVSPKAVV
jgi:mono/diheme cytochrome c family protein